MNSGEYYYGGTTTGYAPSVPSTCPSCGHCPTCGRQYIPSYPLYPSYPYPYWYVTNHSPYSPYVTTSGAAVASTV